MRDIELYRHVLGLELPWEVTRVELSLDEGKVDVWADHRRGTRMACPECGRELSIYDHGEERSWRHLDTCQFLTYLHARPPRVECPAHGVRQVRLPSAGPLARFTTLFERLAVDVLKECDVLGAGRLLRLSWDETWHLMERAVQRGLRSKTVRVPAYLGVDEKSAGKGQDYITVVSDLEEGTVEHIADERRQASRDGYFERFHVMGHIGKAVDTVRKRENRALRGAGDDILVGSKYLWLYAKENLPERQRERFAALRDADLKTARAWAIKESLRRLWSYHRPGWGLRHWKSWYFWATHSRLRPVIEVARMLKRRLAGILSYFDHRITNAGSESLNSRIQAIRVAAHGFRNREHFKTAIYFHCGGLNLYPVPVTHRDPG